MIKIHPESVITKGAEAIIGTTKWLNKIAIIKERIEKKYLDKKLDAMIRSERTKKEAKIIVTAKTKGIPVPTLYYVSQKAGQIIMEYIEGIKLKDYLADREPELGKRFFNKLGEYIGRLHKIGIIHGDLTTSNIIVKNDQLFIIDFGLANFSFSEEDRGVDIHLLKRALESTHWNFAKEYFASFLETYSTTLGIPEEEIIRKIEEIESRGRYIEKD